MAVSALLRLDAPPTGSSSTVTQCEVVPLHHVSWQWQQAQLHVEQHTLLGLRSFSDGLQLEAVWENTTQENLWD